MTTSAPVTPAPPDAPEAPDTTDADVAKLIATIKKLDDTHYEVSKATVDAILANPMAVMKGARVVPALKNGKPDGLKLYAIRPSSLFAKLGLTNGDTVQSVNKLPLNNAEDGLELYTKLRSATKLELQLLRRGSPVTVVWTIK